MREITRTGGTTYYIYTHARPDGSIFYVGKGVGDRARDWSQRTEHHKRIVAKHGRRNIKIAVFPAHDERHAYAAERQLIIAMRKAGLPLCNNDDGGLGRIGVRIGEQQRARISASLMGHPVSEETRRKMSAATLGKKLSAEHIEKLKRRKLSDSHKAALLKAITGRPVSEEHKAKSRAKMLGRKLTEEHRKKLGDSRRGVKQDPAAVAKRAIAIKAAWARRKQEAA